MVCTNIHVFITFILYHISVAYLLHSKQSLSITETSQLKLFAKMAVSIGRIARTT
jgi:hypothetical protein